MGWHIWTFRPIQIVVTGTRPIWRTMMEQGVVTTKVFSIWLRRYSDSGKCVEIVFGGTDQEHFTGAHTYFEAEGPHNIFKLYSFLWAKLTPKFVPMDAKFLWTRGVHTFVVHRMTVYDYQTGKVGFIKST
ncbi:hypothetical protein YC2023_034465 [Brassica napus]